MPGRFVKNIVIRGTIRLRTGLHIGGLKETVDIGGTDNPIIATYKEYGSTVKEVPYIPGSSLKGKIRSLLELAYADDIKNDGKKSEMERQGYVKVGENYIKYESEKAKMIPKIFGIPADTKGYDENAARLIVRDAFPTEDTLRKWDDMPEVLRGAEIKPENSVNRITSRANPRFFERVPADSEFQFEMVLRIHDEDKEEKLLNMVLEGMKMLEDNYLGGFGSRGYGKITFSNLEITERNIAYYEGKGDEKVKKKGGTLDELLKEPQGGS